MSTIRTLLMLLVLLVFVPAYAYALVDFSFYGGYSLGGEIEMGDFKNNVQSGTLGENSTDIKGWEYGFLAHINTGVPMLFTAGIGGFYQISPLTYDYKYELTNQEFDAQRDTYGIDGYIQLDLPILPVFPYLRGGVAIKDETEFETVEQPLDPAYSVLIAQGIPVGSVKDRIKEKYFKSYYYGLGISYTLFDFVVMDFQLFAEYLFTKSKLENNIEMKGHSIHGGVKLAL